MFKTSEHQLGKQKGILTKHFSMLTCVSCINIDCCNVWQGIYCYCFLLLCWNSNKKKI